MEDLQKLIKEIEENVNSFLVDAKKMKSPKQAWRRARKMTIILQKQFKEFRKLSVETAKQI